MKGHGVSGQSPVIDFGAHLYPDSVFPEDVYGDHPLGNRLGRRLSDPDTLLEYYDEAGIDAAVLSQPYYMGHEDTALVAKANDALLDVVRAHEGLYGLAAVPVGAGGDAAASELERCLEAGYSGGALETRSNDISFPSPEIEPILRVAEAWQAPLLVHPKLHDTLHPAALDDRLVLNAIFGREVGLAASICRAIHEGYTDRFDVPLVFHHYGGNIASMTGRLHLQLDAGRWPGRQEHVLSYDEFKSRLEERIWIDTSGFFGYSAPLTASLREFPSSQILFATDYPFEGRSPDELAAYVETVRRCASRTDGAKILGTTAGRLLDRAETPSGSSGG